MNQVKLTNMKSLLNQLKHPLVHQAHSIMLLMMLEEEQILLNLKTS